MARAFLVAEVVVVVAPGAGSGMAGSDAQARSVSAGVLGLGCLGLLRSVMLLCHACFGRLSVYRFGCLGRPG